jgi:hypothetical protein
MYALGMAFVTDWRTSEFEGRQNTHELHGIPKLAYMLEERTNTEWPNTTLVLKLLCHDPESRITLVLSTPFKSLRSCEFWSSWPIQSFGKVFQVATLGFGNPWCNRWQQQLVCSSGKENDDWFVSYLWRRFCCRCCVLENEMGRWSWVREFKDL